MSSRDIPVDPETFTLLSEHLVNLENLEKEWDKKHVAIRGALDHLSPRESQVVVRKVFERMTDSAIATELGIGERQVAQVYRNARTKMGYLLEDGIELGIW